MDRARICDANPNAEFTVDRRLSNLRSIRASSRGSNLIIYMRLSSSQPLISLLLPHLSPTLSLIYLHGILGEAQLGSGL